MSHRFYDKIRGVNSALSSDNSDAANQYAAYGQFESFDSDGFTVGVGTNTDGTQGYGTNQNSQSIASWNWKANGAGSANTDGTINSTVSVDTTSGFSIVKYVGNDTAGATVGHGLGVVPKMIIVKRISGSAQDWIVYHGANTSAPETDYLMLNSTNGTGDSAGVWNDTAPTSSVFSWGSASSVNGGGGADSFIAYCFAEKVGYSKIGSYVGNGNADGAFIYTGFKPAWLLIKMTTTNGDRWVMLDSKRDTFNVSNKGIYADDAQAENPVTSEQGLDILSNGFKIRNSNTKTNTSGSTYIYIAIGQSLVGSNNVPCTAR